MEIWLSAMAAILTTGAFVPQALHILRHKETKAISLEMYVAFASGVALWLLFGIMIDNWPMIVANAVTLALALAIIMFAFNFLGDGLRDALDPRLKGTD